jgi:inosine triphosphate pyrophosphatase
LDKTGHVGLNNLLAAYEDKSAYAQCTFAYSSGPGAEPVVFDGRTAGKIVPARGEHAFGWDPVFEPDEGGGLTYAQMASADKHVISHRRRSLDKLTAYLRERAAGSAE